MKAIKMITLLLFVLLLFTSVQGKKTTCIAVTKAENSILTCFFSEDVSRTKKDITVFHHYGQTLTRVVDCSWYSDILNCTTKESYRFNGIVTDQMTVEITKVTQRETGMYTCEISESDPADRDSCQLSAGITTCEIQSVEEMSNTTLTCLFPEDVSLSKKDYSVYHISGNSKAVLKCRWLSDEPKCLITSPDKHGYDHIVTNITKVHIQQVTITDVGSYQCEISGATPEQHQKCQLSVLPPTTCEINSVKETEITTLTCNFPEDLSLSRKSFYVNHNNDTVVNCQWTHREWTCTTKDGHKLMENATSRAKVQILKVTGYYSCRVSGYKSFEQCYLLNQGKEVGSSNSSLTQGHIAGITIGVILGIVVILAILCYMFRRRLSQCCRRALRLPVQTREDVKVERKQDQEQHQGSSSGRNDEEGQNDFDDLKKQRGSSFLRMNSSKGSSSQEGLEQPESSPLIEGTPAPVTTGQQTPVRASTAAEIHNLLETVS